MSIVGAVGDPTGVAVLAAAIAVEGSSSVAIYEADGLRLSRFGRAGQPDLSGIQVAPLSDTLHLQLLGALAVDARGRSA